MVKPYDLYVRFLVTLGLDTVEKVNEQLQELALYPIEPEEFDQQFHVVHDHVSKPVSDQIVRQKPEGEFLRWMKVLDVAEMWQLEKPYRNPDNAHLKLVRDINYDPQLRITLRGLLMKGVKPLDIVQSLNLKFSYMLKVEHVELYMKFFWDPRKMTRGAWRSYLADCDEREKALIFTALTENLEVLKTFLDLPSQVNISDTLQFLFTSSFQKAKHYLRLTTKEANAEAREWIKHTVALADKYEKHRTGNVEDFGKSLQLEFDYIDTEFPSPDEQTMAELKAKQKQAEELAQAKDAAAAANGPAS